MFEGLGVSGAVLVRPRRAWNAFGVHLRASEVRLGGCLEAILGHLGQILEGFGVAWSLPGSFLGVFLEDFLPS